MFRGREADNPSVFCPSLIGPDIVFPSIESEDELSPWMYEEGARQVYQRLGVFSRGSTVNIDVGNCIHTRSVGKGQLRREELSIEAAQCNAGERGRVQRGGKRGSSATRRGDIPTHEECQLLNMMIRFTSQVIS